MVVLNGLDICLFRNPKDMFSHNKACIISGDIYVHADLHGASSVVIKNPTGREDLKDNNNKIFPILQKK